MAHSRTKRDHEGEGAPAPLTCHTLSLQPDQMDQVKQYCDHHLWEFFAAEYARFGFRNKARKVTVVGYQSGKLVVSGKGTADFVRDFLEPEITREARLGYDEVHHPEWFEAHAGLDEAGKGDFFGPVVACTVVAGEDAVREWIKSGVKDSKSLGEKTIKELDRRIRQTPGVVVKTAYCGMEKYNALMAKPAANLNRLLAWLHARALQAALAERQVPWGLLDQFSKQPLVQRQLKKDGTDFDLRMRTKAESDPVVAAASIGARAEFVRQMDRLREDCGVDLPYGAGPAVKAAAAAVLEKIGPESLPKLAKMHFRTAFEVLGLPVPEKKVWRRDP